MDWTLLPSVSIASPKGEYQIQNSTGNLYLPRRFGIPRFEKHRRGRDANAGTALPAATSYGESIMIDLPSA
jgi:hypothetical protein